MADNTDTSTAGTPTAAHEDGVSQTEQSRLCVSGVIETTLCCPNLAAAETFYTKILNFDVLAKEEGRHLFFRCGNSMLLLFNPEHTSVTVTEVDDIPESTTQSASTSRLTDAGEVIFTGSRMGGQGVAVFLVPEPSGIGAAFALATLVVLRRRRSRCAKPESS